MKKISLLLVFIVLLCTACSQTSTVLDEPPLKPVTDLDEPPRNPAPDLEEPSQKPVAGMAEQVSAVPETEDHTLLTLSAPLADGRTLTLEAVGKALNEYFYGVREVQVYDENTLLQTIVVREAIEAEWGDGMSEDFYDYTECWSPEVSMEVLDLNLDGNTDFGLFGHAPNNTIPYYYWQWDGERYQYTGVLPEAEVHPETGEVSTAYRGGWSGGVHQCDYYRPDGNGSLYLVRQERECSGEWDYHDGYALETWVPREGVVIRPSEQNEDDLVLIRREISKYEVQADGTVSHFTEIWELRDGQLQMTSREERVDD